MSYRVFISYASGDFKVAETVRDALEREHIPCWMAPRDLDPGDDWADMICQAIERCEVLIVVFSKHANDSHHVAKEVCLAVDHKHWLIPYRIEEVLPERGLRYYLCDTHWLNALPSGNGRGLKELCQIVHGVLAKPRAHHHPPPPPRALEESDREMELALVERMIEQGQVVVHLTGFTADQMRAVERLEAAGVFREEPSASRPGERFTTPATPDQCRRLLAEWVRRRAALPPEDLLSRAARLPLLADGLATFLAQQPWAAARTLLRGVAAVPQPITERVIAAAVTELSVDQRLDGVLQLVLETDNEVAVRGLALAVQHLLDRGRLEAADQLLVAIAAWGESPSRAVAQRCFVVGLANERGRLLRRRGQLVEAETQLRDTLAQARQLGDSALAGIVATNLALVLLDQDAGQRGAEAVALLEHALPALQAPDYLLERAAALHNLGEAYCRVDVHQAEDCFRREVALAGEMRTVGPLIDAHDRLGVFLAEQGRHAEAEGSLREAVRLCDGGFEPRRRARTLGNLGALYLRRAQPTGDQAELRRAVQILTESDRWFGHVDVPQLHAAALDNLGRAQFWLGDKVQGVATLRRSIEQFRRWPQGRQRADQIQAELDALASTQGEDHD